MRKLVGILAIVATTLIPVAANAQGFIVGMMVGGLMFGGSSSSQYSSGGEGTSIIYVMPRYAERIKDPLAVITMPEGCMLWHKDIREHFRLLRHTGDCNTPSPAKDWDSSKYEIVQVMRVSHQGRADYVLYWFAYTEKTNVKSLTELPQESATH